MVDVLEGGAVPATPHHGALHFDGPQSNGIGTWLLYGLSTTFSMT
jgi:hypothetical protein